MFSLQVQIRNLTAVLHDKPLPQQQPITIRFGPLQTDISIEAPHFSGGKRLLLQMQQSEMENLKSTYAFGLFMVNHHGRFWSIVSLEKVKANENYSCNHLIFYDDDRNRIYEFQLAVMLAEYKPRMPKQRKSQQQQPQTAAQTSNKKINSFLFGDNTQAVPKPPQPPQPPKKRPKTQKNTNERIMRKQQKISYAVANNVPTNQQFNNYPLEDDIDIGIYIPPAMEFTNNPEPVQPIGPAQTTNNWKKQQMQQIQAQETKMKQAKSPKLETFMDYSQFKEHNKTIKPNDKLTKQQLRELARKQAQAQMSKKQTQIMVPVPNLATGTYTLVPLSSMSEAQIIQYAQKQQQAEELKRLKQQQQARRRKKEQKKLKKQEMIGRMGKQGNESLAKQNIGLTKKFSKQKISQKNKESSDSSSIISEQSQKDIKQEDLIKRNRTNSLNNSRNPKIVQDQIENEISQDDNYESDFDSISNAGSQLKSRISLQSSFSASQKDKKKVNESEVSESMYDYQYSQDFDSFSQSMLSKNKRASSISEISGSYTSMSNRKP